MKRAVVIGSGAALPRNAVSNDDLAKKVDTSDEWIQQRTGIKQRYIAEADETTASLGAAAARDAMAHAGVEYRGYRPDNLRNIDARQHVPRDRRQYPGSPWYETRCCFRYAGGLLGLCLRNDDCQHLYSIWAS